MAFDIQYDNFMKEHLQNRLGESLRRLQEGHGHAEKLFLEQVWWPAIGHFKHLSPEYEVNDFKDGYVILIPLISASHFRFALRLTDMVRIVEILVVGILPTI